MDFESCFREHISATVWLVFFISLVDRRYEVTVSFLREACMLVNHIIFIGSFYKFSYYQYWL